MASMDTSDMKFRILSTDRCDVTGNEVDLRISLFNGRLIFSEKALFKLQDVIGNREGIYENGNYFVYNKMECDLCSENNHCIKINTSEIEKKGVCRKCLFYMADIYGVIKDCIIHDDESGFKIVSFRKEKEFYDVVSGCNKNEEDIVLISSFSISGFSCSLSNIRKLADGLKNPQDYDFLELDDNQIMTCQMCYDDEHEGGVTINISFMCHDCRKKVYSSLDNVMKNNNEVISLLI